jgi:hypothetical protein
MMGYYIQIGHDRFLSHPFEFAGQTRPPIHVIWRKQIWKTSAEKLMVAQLVSTFIPYARFGIFTAVKTDVTVLCLVTPCSDVAGYRRFREPSCLLEYTSYFYESLSFMTVFTKAHYRSWTQCVTLESISITLILISSSLLRLCLSSDLFLWCFPITIFYSFQVPHSWTRSVVFNGGYAYPQGYAKTS